MELRAEHVNKTIGGKIILSDINLEMHSGCVYGFVGSNGSGKTMLFRALSGLMSVTSGTITWNGKVLRRDFSVLPSLGILLENVRLYSDMTGMDNLRYLANINGKIGDEEICNTLKRVGLDPNDRRKYQKYSLGMKQRLAIAQAVMEKPDVIMLDEPTNSLDEIGVNEFRRLILEEKKRGAVILLASHNQEDIRILSDYIYKIDNGKIICSEVNKT